MNHPDLLTWREEADALAGLDAAREAWAVAARKARCAPHGELFARRARLAQATRALLEAELLLARVRRVGR